MAVKGRPSNRPPDHTTARLGKLRATAEYLRTSFDLWKSTEGLRKQAAPNSLTNIWVHFTSLCQITAPHRIRHHTGYNVNRIQTHLTPSPTKLKHTRKHATLAWYDNITTTIWRRNRPRQRFDWQLTSACVRTRYIYRLVLPASDAEICFSDTGPGLPMTYM